MKKIIIGIVIGIIISATTVYAASILSSSVVYDNSTSNGSSKTVQGALDELYSKINYGTATAEDILMGKTALVQGEEVVGNFDPSSNDIKEYCSVVWNNGSVGVIANFEDKFVKGVGSSSSGIYFKLSYSSETWTITALKDGKYNVMNSSGVISEMEAKAGEVLISSSSYKNLIYCAAWI